MSSDNDFRWTDGVATAQLRGALNGVENERRAWSERVERIEALQRAERLDPLSSRHEEREYAEGVQYGLDLAAKLIRSTTEQLRYIGEQLEAKHGQVAE